MLVGEFWPSPSANGVIAGNIANELAKDSSVTVLTRRTRRSMPHHEIHNGVSVVRIDDWHLILHNSLMTRRGSAAKWSIPLWSALIFVLRGSNWLSRAFRRDSVNWGFVKRLEKALMEIDEQKPIDVLIPVSAPHEETFAGVSFKESHPETVLIVYQLDRFANAESLYELRLLRSGKEMRNMHLERRVLDVSNALFILPPLEDHYARPELSHLVHKITRTEHPLVQDLRSRGSSPLSEPGKPVLLYAGSLDLKLRNPSFLISVLADERLRSLGISVHMYAYGSGAELVRQAASGGSHWLSSHGRVGIEEVHLAMARADVLLTIGNNSDSEVPSKLFEYLSFGKPILHFYFSERDAYLGYLEKYPQALTLKIGGDSEREDAVIRITRFLLDGTHGDVSMDYVQQTFRECTPAFVARQFRDAINADATGTS